MKWEMQYQNQMWNKKTFCEEFPHKILAVSSKRLTFSTFPTELRDDAHTAQAALIYSALFESRDT